MTLMELLPRRMPPPPQRTGSTPEVVRRSSAPSDLIIIPENNVSPAVKESPVDASFAAYPIGQHVKYADDVKDLPDSTALPQMQQQQQQQAQEADDDGEKTFLTMCLAAGVIVSTAVGAYIGILFNPAALIVLVVGNSLCIICSELFLHSRKSFAVSPPLPDKPKASPDKAYSEHL